MSNGLIRLSAKRNIYSTIFKTIQDLTTGKTKITSSGFFNGIFKGDFFKAQPVVSESDIAALENYNNLLANNKPQEAFDQAMKNASQTAQNLAKSAKGAAVDINAIPKASKAAAAGLKFLSVAGNMLLYMAIAKGIQWILTFNERLEESRQKMIEAGQEASRLTKDLDGLVEQYRKLGADGKFDNSDREQARSIQEQINALLGDEAHYIDLSNGSYKHQLELLRRLQHEQANAKYATIKDAKEAAETSLRSKISNVGVGINIAKAEVEAIEKLSRLPEMDKYLKTYEGDESGKGKFAIFNVDTSSTDAMVESYEKMIELRNILSKSYADEIKKGGSLEDFYNNLTDEIDELSGAVQKYKDAIDDYNINEAVVQFNETDFGGVKGALIDTKEQMELWAKAMVESDDISDGVKENLIGLAKTYYPDLSDAINESVQAHYKEKYAKAGSSSEINKHIKNLDAEAEQCGLTRKAYIDLISAEILFNNNNLNITQKISALQQLAYQAGITADKMREVLMFDSLQKAYDINTHGIEAAYRAGRITKEERDRRKAQILSELNSSLYEGYEDNTDEDEFDYSPEDKSDKNEALDNYLKNAENLYKIHQNEEKYINDLQWAMDNLVKTEKERLDIEGKINEANRKVTENEIKDLEHQIDLKKELYGEDVDVTEELNGIQAKAHKGADDYRAYAREQLGYDSKTDEEKAVIDEMIENTDEIQGFQKTWWDAENEKLDFYSKQHENIIRDIEHARDMELDKNPYADTTSYYKQMQTEYHKQAEYLRALDPEKYKEDIQKLQQAWSDAQKAIADWSYSNSERWINERNTFNDWDLYSDNEVVAWERVLKRFQVEFPNELEKIKDIEQKIFEARKAAMDKSIDDIEDYINARNHYNDWDAFGDSELKALQRQTEIIEDEYEQRLISYDEYIDKLEEQTQRIYSLGQDRVDKHLSNIDKYIDARNTYNDWGSFGDTEIEAIKRQLQILDEARKLDLISLEDYTEKYAEYTQKLYSVAKNDIIETISKLIEDYEEIKQDEIDALSFESSQYSSLQTLLQSFYNVTNAVAEAQREINKELRASQSMYEYLDEETRELLFNQEDYNALNEELLDIQTAANELQKQYEEDILGATEETIAEITSQYQMQYETLMKQYEIAKAELEVAKKRQQLDNVLAERNVRMFINGQWQWVANTQDVINAENELADAEAKKEQKEEELNQAESINKLTAAQDAIATQINYLESDLEEVRKYWSDMQNMLNGSSDEVERALKQISRVSSPELKKIIKTTGSDVKGFSSLLSESTTTLSTIISSDLSGVSTNIGDIITDLQNYSKAIQDLTDKINGADSNKNSGSSTKDIVAEMKANSEKWYTASEAERQELHELNQQLGDSIGATYDESTGKWYSSDGKLLYSTSSSKSSSSSGGGSSSSKSSSNKKNATATIPGVGTVGVNINSSGKTTTTGLPVGTIVHTAGGDYRITGGTGGNYTSVKIEEKDADGTRYTRGGLTLMGEEGFEAFISNNGRLIPISQPTIGNIGAGGIVFNREQMANLRNLWDLSNIGKMSPLVSSLSTNKQNTVIDNSIHINGLTVGEQGNEDWINGLRRYVATHK